jgi:hypothetical protein
VLRRYELIKEKHKDTALESILDKVAGQRFHNHSPLTLTRRGAVCRSLPSL